MAYNKIYTRINWINKSEGTKTPLDAANLNTIDYAVNELDNRIVEQEIIKANQSTVLSMVKDWFMDGKTGIITVTKLNGEKLIFDLNIEKIPVSFALSASGILTMTTSDGTKFTADIGNMIPVLTFQSTDTIAVTVSGSGKDKTYSFALKDGSVTEDKLQPNYLADIRTETATATEKALAASNSATAAKTSQTAAKESETAAKSSQTAAKTSETAAAASQTAARTSETNAAASQTAAKTSETNAKSSETKAKTSETNAAASETAAKTSETNAKTSETNAKTSETNAKTSETAAGKSAEAAAKSAAKAATVVGIDIATTAKAGIVKPDGTSIKVDGEGKIATVANVKMKNINTADGVTKFRTTMNDGTDASSFLTVIRNNASTDTTPIYGAGLGWGVHDTHTYLMGNYASKHIFAGAGNGDKLNWYDELAFLSSNVASATKATQDDEGNVIKDSYFMSKRGNIAAADIDTFVSRKSGCYFVNLSGASDLLTVFAPQTGSASALEIYSNYPLNTLKVRGAIDNNRYTDWKYIAFTTSNVASATRLQSTRKINGIPFNGTNDITVPPNTTTLTNEDLNTLKTPGLYCAGGSNTCTNKPAGVDAFGMEVLKSASGWYTQVLYASNNQQKTYIRWFNSGSWTAWERYATKAEVDNLTMGTSVYTGSANPNLLFQAGGAANMYDVLNRDINKSLQCVESGTFNNETISLNLKDDATYLLVTRGITVSTGKIYGYRVQVITTPKDFVAVPTRVNMASTTNAEITISNIPLDSSEYGITMKAGAAYEVSYALYEFHNTHGYYKDSVPLPPVN